MDIGKSVGDASLGQTASLSGAFSCPVTDVNALLGESSRTSIHRLRDGLGLDGKVTGRSGRLKGGFSIGFSGNGLTLSGGSRIILSSE